MITLVVEGESDRAAAEAVANTAGHDVCKTYVMRGKSKLDPKVSGFNQAAINANWAVFRDSDGECPVKLRARLTQGFEESPHFALRIAHTMIEAWLLADRISFSEYFKVREGKLPSEPEQLGHAKRYMLELFSKSTSRSLRGELVTKKGGPGPLFVHHLNLFAAEHWNVDEALLLSPSLRGAVRRLTQMNGYT